MRALRQLTTQLTAAPQQAADSLRYKDKGKQIRGQYNINDEKKGEVMKEYQLREQGRVRAFDIVFIQDNLLFEKNPFLFYSEREEMKTCNPRQTNCGNGGIKYYLMPPSNISPLPRSYTTLKIFTGNELIFILLKKKDKIDGWTCRNNINLSIIIEISRYIQYYVKSKYLV